jgi:hypothetical protein
MPTTVFDPCNLPPCQHVWGKKCSETRWNRNCRPVRSWVVYFFPCTKCGFRSYL